MGQPPFPSLQERDTLSERVGHDPWFVVSQAVVQSPTAVIKFRPAALIWNALLLLLRSPYSSYSILTAAL